MKFYTSMTVKYIIEVQTTCFIFLTLAHFLFFITRSLAENGVVTAYYKLTV